MHVKKTAVIAATSAVALAVPASAAADYGHVVTPGESIESIAVADGINPTTLAEANGLSASSPLTPGQVIEIPPAASSDSSGASSDSDTSSSSQTSDSSSSSTQDSSSQSAGGYTVQPGDTLSEIAAREGVSASRLAALNGVSTDSPLQAGTSLTMPSSSSTSTGSDSSGSSTSEETSADTGATGSGNQQSSGPDNGPYPTNERVTPSQVGSEASIDGVDPSFASAIADQESGFNNDEVSPTGAVGVMQIEPNTWNWINTYDSKPGAPLNPDSAYGNVAAGARLLHTLVQRTGSNSGAAAAYYQGLDSIQKNGMYNDTKAYVNSVMNLANQF
ncbi:MAG: LysM peptidoglycan-binding domain-containing protein [Solirubrobacterales bacterium]|nr:LysM peptidoglycan-binding domain-containing protein [Solirubrobacterales bacterium]